MQRLTSFLHDIVNWIQPVAERMGAPGLAVIAFLDSSFLSLPEVADALIVVMVVHHPAEWPLFALMTTIGSVAGCYALYAVGRRGGEAFVRKRFNERHVTRGLAIIQRHGLLALVVPSILPPPMPFKIFVLLAGIADVRPATFLLAVTIGRAFRYGGEAWLAYEYGDEAAAFIRDNLPQISAWVAGIVAVVGVAIIIWRRHRAA
jgi:membrane protein YqaA with SNARE-associated domain